MFAYHDLEWGVPLHDDRGLFEFLILEGAQAGLSWSTILKKRSAYRAAFDRFNPREVARYGDEIRVSTLSSTSSPLGWNTGTSVHARIFLTNLPFTLLPITPYRHAWPKSSARGGLHWYSPR
jgi:hypothetical protein